MLIILMIIQVTLITMILFIMVAILLALFISGTVIIVSITTMVNILKPSRIPSPRQQTFCDPQVSQTHALSQSPNPTPCTLTL